MSKKKLVDREHLDYLGQELFYIGLAHQTDERIQSLIQYVNDHIIQRDQEEKNEFKRAIYQRMKNATTQEESQQWYDLYKSLD